MEYLRICQAWSRPTEDGPGKAGEEELERLSRDGFLGSND